MLGLKSASSRSNMPAGDYQRKEIMADQMTEVVDRTRRIETRMMKFFEHMGFDTQVQRPLWRNGRVEIPTLACSLHDCLAVVPASWPKEDEIDVWHKGQFVMTFFTSLG